MVDYRPKIRLSQDEFRVLASSTRIDILKLLDESQYTVSDVSRKLAMNKATVHEHLTKLMEVGLVKKEESPRKWVYYRLTWKGRNLLHPERVRVMVSLAIIAMVIVIGGLLVAYQTPFQGVDDGNGTLVMPPSKRSTVDFAWEQGGDPDNVADIKFDTISAITMTSVKAIDFFIETNPTSINRTVPIDLDWSREGDTIHVYDYRNQLDEHEGKYLWVEGTVMDDQAVERNFGLRRYIVPTGKIDLGISALGITIDTSNLPETGIVNISFAVENVGTLDVKATLVEVFSVMPQFVAFGFPGYSSPYLEPLYNLTIDVPVNGTQNVSFEVHVTQLFLRGVMVFLDPDNELPELSEQNDMATVELPDTVKDHNKDLYDTSIETGDEPVFGLASLVVAVAILISLIIAAVIYLWRL